jgi:hypothetical protein
MRPRQVRAVLWTVARSCAEGGIGRGRTELGTCVCCRASTTMPARRVLANKTLKRQELADNIGHPLLSLMYASGQSYASGQGILNPDPRAATMVSTNGLN